MSDRKMFINTEKELLLKNLFYSAQDKKLFKMFDKQLAQQRFTNISILSSNENILNLSAISITINDLRNIVTKFLNTKKTATIFSGRSLYELVKFSNLSSQKINNSLSCQKISSLCNKLSDVSHELKTPIALIQGYSEGLLENVNTNPESRQYYAEVILDESNKMDKLVKQLLELMKLEYGKREFNNKEFNLTELEEEVVKKSDVMVKEKQAELRFEKTQENITVFADNFYIEQVLTNYLTNAIKNVKEKYEEKYIKVSNKIIKNENKVRVTVFNTGDNISDENLNRIWNRFYKADESRNRANGGTGIGLAFVKAIMNNYGNKYGVKNLENGVEFYFELDLKKGSK